MSELEALRREVDLLRREVDLLRRERVPAFRYSQGFEVPRAPERPIPGTPYPFTGSGTLTTAYKDWLP